MQEFAKQAPIWNEIAGLKVFLWGNAIAKKIFYCKKLFFKLGLIKEICR